LSVAVKKSLPLTFVRFAGNDELLASLMSLTIVVPAAVPLLLHSSAPFVPSLAVKNRVPLTFTRLPGEELALPGLMFITGTVPPEVPSLFHSSIPVVPSLAVKNSMPFTFVRLPGEEEFVLPTQMSLTSTASVPFHFQSSILFAA